MRKTVVQITQREKKKNVLSPFSSVKIKDLKYPIHLNLLEDKKKNNLIC